MTTPTFKMPANAAEAAAAETAVATYYLSRIQAACDLMNGTKAKAFEAEVTALLADALPAGTSAAVNLPQVAKWFVDVRTGLEADRASLDRIVNPAPVVPEPAPEADPAN